MYLLLRQRSGAFSNSTKKLTLYMITFKYKITLFTILENKRKKTFISRLSCIYPKNSNIPIKESELLSGKLEDTNDAYAIAKIAGIKMCRLQVAIYF